MHVGHTKKFLVIISLMSTIMCRKPYEPPAIKASNHFLAVDGIINIGSQASTSIQLTRSVSLLDSIPYLPELNAQVVIKSSTGAAYPLVDTSSSGIYVSGQLDLDPTLQYQVAVTTNDGNTYLTDLVTPKAAPPIDSITWELVEDATAGTQAVNIYANAHDPTNNTRFYRWDYTETWQHASALETFWGLKNGLMYPISPDESTHNCWNSGHSQTILLGTTITLSSDVMSHAAIAHFLKNDPKMDIDYSILIRQYPLDQTAYNYWITVQKNSQSLGGLFDLQPAQITGNFHSVSNPANPALGFVSASTIQEARLFISNGSLPGWQSDPQANCPIKIIPTDPNNYAIWNYPDTSYQLWYFVSGPPPTGKITYKSCLDCRYQGGSNIKPSFWQ
jgi:Domain of unknown function (DUF4249)